MQNDDTNSLYDVVIVGGGPAGLAAAFWLGRYRRRVQVLDTDEPRNEPTWAVHGYPALPDLPPMELRERLRGQAQGTGAEHVAARVTRVDGEKNAFLTHTSAGPAIPSRRVLLAYGRRDHLPDVAGLRDVYGTVAFHCPDCDGPSMVGCQVAVIGWERSTAAQALYLLTWAREVMLLTDGHEPELDASATAVLEKYGVRIHRNRIRGIHPMGGASARIDLDGATGLGVDGIFFHMGSEPKSDIAEELGCQLNDRGELLVDRGQETTVPGVYAAGDIASGLSHLAIHAAAEGVRAALSIHRSLLPPDWEL